MNAQIGFAGGIDEVTLLRLRRGDNAAFEAVYRRYGRASYNLALRIAGSEAAAEDVVQEAFLTLMRRARSLRDPLAFGGWLKRVVANQAIDYLRSRRLVDLQSDLGEHATEWKATDQGWDADQAAGPELLQRLLALSPAARSVLVLHEIEGYTHAEIAEMFGMTESFSKSLLSRTLKRLREELAPRAPTEVSHV
ncbi:MAG TPA: sigma-70 family RNA polymerase sigma factor [Xanthomonadaceae bacterium]|nr:sigma-70 family RNA polymerase sigma factor [Xanthomonadaceae bacterium]